MVTGFDVYSDLQTGRGHWNDKNYLWALTTWALMFMPSALSFIIQSAIIECRHSLKTVAVSLGHLPLVQPIYHLFILRNLKKASDDMSHQVVCYKGLDFDNLPSNIKEEVVESARKHEEAKKEFSGLLSQFQYQKLYEGFAESAPQACLQIAIIIMQGKCSTTQIVSIIISLFSLAIAATDIFLTLPTKQKKLKEASWKTKFFIVLPTMFVIFLPRIFTISIVVSYVKEYIFLILTILILTNLIANTHFLKRDPGQVILGLFTNLFAPNIVIEEGSAFYQRSSILPNFIYSLVQIALCLMVVFGVIVPIPCKKTESTIFHCFLGDMNDSSTFVKRCPLNSDKVTNCTYENIFIDDFEDCKDDLILIEEKSPLTYVTICNKFYEQNQIPLVIATVLLVFMFGVASILIKKVLKRILDPIDLLQFSRTCVPTRFLDIIWPDEERKIAGPILHFLIQPNKETLEESNMELRGQTGDDLIDIALENDYTEVLKQVFSEKVDEPVTKAMVEKAILFSSPKTIKFIGKKAQLRQNLLHELNLDELEKTLQGMRGRTYFTASLLNQSILFALFFNFDAICFF